MSSHLTLLRLMLATIVYADENENRPTFEQHRHSLAPQAPVSQIIDAAYLQCAQWTQHCNLQIGDLCNCQFAEIFCIYA